MRSALERIGALAGFGLDVLGGYFQTLGFGEAVDGRALGLDAKT